MVLDHDKHVQQAKGCRYYHEEIAGNNPTGRRRCDGNCPCMAIRWCDALCAELQINKKTDISYSIVGGPFRYRLKRFPVGTQLQRRPRSRERLRRQLAHQLYETDRGDAFTLGPRFCTAVNEIALFYLERLSCAVKAAREGWG